MIVSYGRILFYRLLVFKYHQMSRSSETFRFSLLEGDGIGARFPENKQIDSMTLPAVVEEVVARINGLYGVEVQVADTVDLSLDARVASAETPDDLDAYYAGVVARVMASGGLSLKMPTTTGTKGQVEEAALKMDVSDRLADSAWIQAQTSSPNDKLRNGLDYSYMDRGVNGVHGLERVPSHLPPLNVFSLGDAEYFFSTGADGQIYRTFDSAKIDEFAAEIEAYGAKRVVIATKHTISPLDKTVVAALKARLPQAEIVLFDSFLPGILAGKHEDALVVAMPDQAGMLAGLREISGEPLPTAIDANVPLPDRMTVRLAKGSGYGETLERADTAVLRETHTINQRDVTFAVQKARQLAAEKGQKPFVVLIGGDNNPADALYLQYVNQAMDESAYETISMSDLMKDLARNPHDPRFSVLLTPNHIGDYITDFLPGLHYGQLGNAALGLGENASFAFDDNGVLTALGTDPSTGTAPDLLDPLHPEKARGILPAGALLSLATLLMEAPDHGSIYPAIGLQMREAILDVALDLHKGGVRDYASFVDRLILRLESKPGWLVETLAQKHGYREQEQLTA